MNLNCRLEGRQNQTGGLSISTQRHDSQNMFIKVVKVSQLFLFLSPSSLVTLKTLKNAPSLLVTLKTKGFLTFSEGIEREHWAKMS